MKNKRTQDYVSVMMAYMMGREVEVRDLNDGYDKWYKTDGEPLWDWTKREWRVVS